MKKRYIVFGLVLCLILALGALFGPKLYRAVRIRHMAEEFLSAESGSVDVRAAGEETGQIDFRLDWQDIGEKRVYILSANSVTVYCCQGTVYLENGKGYAFGEAIADVPRFWEDPWLLYPMVQLHREGAIWTVMLEAGQLLPELGALTVDLEAGNGTLEEIHLLAQASDKSPNVLSAYGRIRRDRDALEIPGEVLDAIENGVVQGGGDLTEDVLRLLKGWVQLGARDPLAMELELMADCGVLSIGDTLQIYRTAVEGVPISYVEKPGLGGLYFTDKAVCTADGRLLTSQESSVEAARLLGLAYYLCLNGELECSEGVYRLTLDREGIEQIAYAIAPEARQMNVELTGGSLELVMEADTIASIRFDCSGRLDLLLTQVDASISAQLEFSEEETQFTVPQAVIKALTE